MRRKAAVTRQVDDIETRTTKIRPQGGHCKYLQVLQNFCEPGGAIHESAHLIAFSPKMTYLIHSSGTWLPANIISNHTIHYPNISFARKRRWCMQHLPAWLVSTSLAQPLSCVLAPDMRQLCRAVVQPGRLSSTIVEAPWQRHHGVYIMIHWVKWAWCGGQVGC